MGADALWAWKSFLRGRNPTLYDLGLAAGFAPLDPALEPVRRALGDTRRLADRIDLARTTRHGDLTSSGFTLARPGEQYVALRPADHVGPLKLELAAGTYSVSWFDVYIRTTFAGDDLVIGRAGTATISSPVPGAHACVVHVSRRR